ncbi:histone H2A [Basidiobolus ranarum]|uniref:Histone H2A n=1 Tax=Basidiobolus ranarum TaxID=34480 RepID=A0ABR2VUD4_9FUNG
MPRRGSTRKDSTNPRNVSNRGKEPEEESYVEDQCLENSQTMKTRLIFPVDEVIRKMKIFSGMEVTLDAGIYLTSMIQHVIEDILDEAVYKVQDAKTGRIVPKDINEIIKHDTEWSKLFKNVVIAQGGICSRDKLPIQNLNDSPEHY